MGCKNGDGNCFDAPDRGRPDRPRISGGDGFSVVLMASPPRRIVPEPSEDARKVVAEIEQPAADARQRRPRRHPQHRRKSGARLAAANIPSREVYFITDLQQSTWIARQPGTLSATVQKISEPAQTIFVDVGRDGVGNLAVDESGARRLDGDHRPHDAPLATLPNYGDTRTDVIVRLFVGKARAAGSDKAYDLHEVKERSSSRSSAAKRRRDVRLQVSRPPAITCCWFRWPTTAWNWTTCRSAW